MLVYVLIQLLGPSMLPAMIVLSLHNGVVAASPAQLSFETRDVRQVAYSAQVRKPAMMSLRSGVKKFR